MKNNYILSLVSLAFMLTACNSGGARRVSGKQCKANYSVTMAPGKGEAAVSLDPVAKELVPGTYEYQGATAYFHDKTENFRVEIVDAKNAKDPKAPNEFKAIPSCVRNAKGGLMLGFETVGVSRLVVEAAQNGDLKTIYDVKSYGVTVVPGSMKVTSKLGQEKVIGAPGKAYENTATPILIKKNQTDYEIRSVFEDNNRKVYLVVRLKWSKPQ